jgi:hypothetical protein
MDLIQEVTTARSEKDLILLDQVGKCFRPVGANWTDERSGVGRA